MAQPTTRTSTPTSGRNAVRPGGHARAADGSTTLQRTDGGWGGPVHRHELGALQHHERGLPGACEPEGPPSGLRWAASRVRLGARPPAFPKVLHRNRRRRGFRAPAPTRSFRGRLRRAASNLTPSPSERRQAALDGFEAKLRCSRRGSDRATPSRRARCGRANSDPFDRQDHRREARLADHGDEVGPCIFGQPRSGPWPEEALLPIDQLFLAMTEGGQMPTPADLDRLRERVAQAGFSPSAAERVRSDLVGPVWRGRMLRSGDRFPPRSATTCGTWCCARSGQWAPARNSMSPASAR